jgi:hypothetical protein
MSFHPNEIPDFHPNQIPDFFWNIIERANKDPDDLEKILFELDKNTIYKFAGEFITAVTELTYDEFCENMDVSSEDSQENIREWIVSQGKDYYERIWNNPELIPKYEDIQFDEIMSYRAEFVYEDKFGEEMPNTTDERGYPIYNDIDL